MTPEQREVYDALFVSDDEAEVEIIPDDEDEDGKIYNKVVVTGDDLEGIVQKAMGGQKIRFKGLRDGTFKEKDVLIQDPMKNRKIIYGDALAKKKAKKDILTKKDSKGVSFKPMLGELQEGNDDEEDWEDDDEDEAQNEGKDEEYDGPFLDPEDDILQDGEEIPEEVVEDQLMGYMDASSEEVEDEEEDILPPKLGQKDLDAIDFNIKDIEEINEEDFPTLESQVPKISETEDFELDEAVEGMHIESLVSQTIEEQYGDLQNDEDDDIQNFKLTPDKKLSDKEFESILDNHLRGMGEEGRKILKKTSGKNTDGVNFGKKNTGSVAVASNKKIIAKGEEDDSDGEFEDFDEESEANKSKVKKNQGNKPEESITTEIRPGGGMFIMRKGVKKVKTIKGKVRVPAYKGLYKMHLENAISELNGGQIDELILPGMEQEEKVDPKGKTKPKQGAKPLRGNVNLKDEDMKQVAEDDPELLRFLKENGLDQDFDLEIGMDEEEEGGDAEIEVEEEEEEEDEDPIVKFRLHEKMDIEERIERDKLLPETLNGLPVFKRFAYKVIEYDDDVVLREALTRHANEDIDFSKPPEMIYSDIKEVNISYNPIVQIRSKEEALAGVTVVQEEKIYGKSKKTSTTASRKYTNASEIVPQSKDKVDSGDEEEGDEEEGSSDDGLQSRGNSRADVLNNPLVRRGKKLTADDKKQRKDLVKQMKTERKLKKKQFKEQFEQAKRAVINQNTRRIQSTNLVGLSVHKIE